MIRTIFRMARERFPVWGPSLLFFLLLTATARAGETDAIEHYLDVDRLQAYINRWSDVQEKHDHANWAEQLRELTPAELDTLTKNETGLGDAFNYDGIILKLLKKKLPNETIKPADVAWGYDFFKRKLNDSYKLGSAPTSGPASGTYPPDMAEPKRLPPLGSQYTPKKVLLDADAYTADRTTRAIFWDAARNNHPVDLYAGSAGNFRKVLEDKGGKILATVRTLARNYNPIYLVQMPGESSYHIAITEIAGAERLEHFRLTAGLMRWNHEDGEKHPVVNAYGDPQVRLDAEEATLTKVLKEAPPADHVIIGQKGAFDRTLDTLGKAEATLKLEAAAKAKVQAKLSPAEARILQKFRDEPEERVNNAMKYASDWDKIREKLEPLFKSKGIAADAAFTVFTLDRASYQMSDYVVKGKNGQPMRWRIFSNVWGDEVVPIGKALKTVGVTDPDYIGTAGGFKRSGLRVGDLAMPSASVTADGQVLSLANDAAPEGAHVGGNVTDVASPLEETQAWLKAHKDKSDLVEVETEQLARIFNGPNDKLRVYLLVSDIVDGSGETLDNAESSSRRGAQMMTINDIFHRNGVVGPATELPEASGLSKWQDWAQELAPGREEISRRQLARAAEIQGVATKAKFKKFMEENPTFTTAKMEKVVGKADLRVTEMMEAANGPLARTKFGMPAYVLQGVWNPTNQKLAVSVSVPSAAKAEAWKKWLADKGPEFVKDLDVRILVGGVPKGFAEMEEEGNFAPFRSAVKNAAIRTLGLAITETRAGGMKFVPIGSVHSGEFNCGASYGAMGHTAD